MSWSQSGSVSVLVPLCADGEVPQRLCLFQSSAVKSGMRSSHRLLCPVCGASSPHVWTIVTAPYVDPESNSNFDHTQNSHMAHED